MAIICNLCGMKKSLEELYCSYHYVCKDCWNKIVMTIDGDEIDKDMVY